MTIRLGDVETTALIPVAIKASESLRKNPRVRDEIADLCDGIGNIKSEE